MSSKMTAAMEQLPYPHPPTEHEIKIEEQQIRLLLFSMPRLMIGAVILVVLSIAICIACNFNPMNWLE